MTLYEIREAFSIGTRIYVCPYYDTENRLEMNSMLYGNGLGNVKAFGRSEVIGKGKILVNLDMPEIVFEAWKKFTEDHKED